MLLLLTGLQGSGKTYAAVNVLDSVARVDFKNINNLLIDFKTKLKENQNVYDYIYSNIDDLNIDFKKQTYYSLDFKILKKHMDKMYEISKDDVSAVVEYAKQNKLYSALIVIDECHIFLDKKDPAVDFWIKYHRHLKQDLIFITQVSDDFVYRKVCEKFVSSQRMTFAKSKKNLTYTVYADAKLDEKSKIGSYTLKKDDRLFLMYKSGDIVSTGSLWKTHLPKILIALAVAIVSLFVLYNSIFSKYDVEKEEIKKEKEIVYVEKNKKKDKKILKKDKYYVSFACQSNYDCRVLVNKKFSSYQNSLLQFLVFKKDEILNSHYLNLSYNKVNNFVFLFVEYDEVSLKKYFLQIFINRLYFLDDEVKETQEIKERKEDEKKESRISIPNFFDLKK